MNDDTEDVLRPWGPTLSDLYDRHRLPQDIASRFQVRHPSLFGLAPSRPLTRAQDFALGISGPFGLGSQSALQLSALNRRIATIQVEYDDAIQKLHETEKDAAEYKKAYEKAFELNEKLQREKSAAHLISRVRPEAGDKILHDSEFRKRFTERCDAYVVSIDIRRSTELMLKARTPEQFATFLIELSNNLRAAILEYDGVFDKFTGDGILAYFPKFYSGPDAGYLAVKAADECHKIFEQHYTRNRSSFNSVLLDIGLGIGIDFGRVHLVEIGSELTVVGNPVVYACRMAGADAGTTLANQAAYEDLFAGFENFDFTETSLNIKHEGRTLAYQVRLNGKDRDVAPAPWRVEPPAEAIPAESVQPASGNTPVGT